MSAELNELIRSLREENQELKTANERLLCQKNDDAQKLQELREQISALLQSIYGRRSERFEHPDQVDARA